MLTRCACKGAELSCIIGNIFTELRPPCGGEAVTIHGITPTGHEATITLTAAGFSYLTESGAVIRKVRRKSKNNARRRLTKMRGLLEAGKITPEKVEQSYKSWRGHASKGNCYHLIRNMDQHYNKLFGQYAAAGNRGGVAVSEEKEEGKEWRNN